MRSIWQLGISSILFEGRSIQSLITEGNKLFLNLMVGASKLLIMLHDGSGRKRMWVALYYVDCWWGFGWCAWWVGLPSQLSAIFCRLPFWIKEINNYFIISRYPAIQQWVLVKRNQLVDYFCTTSFKTVVCWLSDYNILSSLRAMIFFNSLDGIFTRFRSPLPLFEICSSDIIGIFGMYSTVKSEATIDLNIFVRSLFRVINFPASSLRDYKLFIHILASQLADYVLLH